MPRRVLPSYTVIKDTREQKGWEFSSHPTTRKPPRCSGMVVDTLKTGDYSIVGYTDILAVERKADFAELWGNYNKDNRPAFEQEMQRMSEMKYRYVVVESSLNPDIFELSPPQFSKGVPGKALIRWLMNISAKFGVSIIPAGSCGKQVTQMIFEEVVRLEKDRWAYS